MLCKEMLFETLVLSGVAQLALQRKKWSTFPAFFITKFVFETSKYQTAVKSAQMRKRNSYVKEIYGLFSVDTWACFFFQKC